MSSPRAADEASRRKDSIDLRRRRATVGALVISLLGVALALWAIATDESDRYFGIGIAAALGGIGFSLVTWSNSLNLPEVEERREPLCLGSEDAAGLRAEVQLTEDTIGRRPLFKWLFGGALAGLGAAALSPLLSLGPRPGNQLRTTAWSAGRRVVTSDGRPVEASRARLDQLVTVFPEGHTTSDDSQVVLVRVQEDLLSEATVEAGAVQGWVAYSKICTHLGCSVGLFGIDTRQPQTLRQLVCPCHQSVFDPLDAARPVGGPAPRPLPQLPLAVDSDGYLVATGDFPDPVGPATWDAEQ